MFNKLFGRNTNFDTESHTTAFEDAMSIQNSIDYVIIKAAWDEYVIIKQRDASYDPEHPDNTPAWRALSKVVEFDGDFAQFTTEEDKSLLAALRQGFILYADVLHVLIDHHDDEQAAQEMFDRYPELHQAVPDEYDNPKQVIEVVIEIIRDYQWQLEHFSDKHGATIDAVLGVEMGVI